MCEGRCRPSLKSDSHSAAVVAALVSVQFRVFHGHLDFNSLLQPESPADHAAATASATQADAELAAVTLRTPAGRKAAKKKPPPVRPHAREGAKGGEEAAGEPHGASPGAFTAEDCEQDATAPRPRATRKMRRVARRAVATLRPRRASSWQGRAQTQPSRTFRAGALWGSERGRGRNAAWPGMPGDLVFDPGQAELPSHPPQRHILHT